MSEQPYFTIYGEDWNYESNTNGTWVDRESFDTLAQRLQEAERLLQQSFKHAAQMEPISAKLFNQIDAFLADKGVKP